MTQTYDMTDAERLAEVGGLWVALLAAQEQCPAPPRNGVNPAFRGSEYVTLDDLLDTVLPVLNRNGIVLVQAPDLVEGVDVLRTTLIHAATGDLTHTITKLHLVKDDPQAHGSAITYARRYALMAMLALVGEDDDDGNAAAAPARPRPEKAKEQRTFDIGRDLLPGAVNVRTEEDAVALRQAIRDFDPEQPWADIENYVTLHLFGKTYEELGTPQKREFWTRTANFVVQVGDRAGGGDFPPPTHEVIMQAYRECFKGVEIALSGPAAEGEGQPVAPAAEEKAENAAEGDGS